MISDSSNLTNQGINHETNKHIVERGKRTKQQRCFSKKENS